MTAAPFSLTTDPGVPAVRRSEVRTQMRRLAGRLTELASPAVDEYRALLRSLGAGVDRPPVWVLSTGRCGTLALQRLLEQTRGIRPFHRDCRPALPQAAAEAFYTVVLGAMTGVRMQVMSTYCLASALADLARARAAGRQFCMVNHGYLAWAPYLAWLVPGSRFLHLARDPHACFLSFYTKDVYRGQLEPLAVDGPSIKASGFGAAPVRRPRIDLPAAIAWYLHACRTYAEALGDVVGPERFESLPSEALFGGKASAFECLGRMLDLAPLDLERFRVHYAGRINEKRDQLARPVDGPARARLLERLDEALDLLRRDGAYPVQSPQALAAAS